MVCSVTFDETYAERKIKELSSKKTDGIKVDRQRFLWEEATFSFDVDSSRVSPFTGEFRKGVLGKITLEKVEDINVWLWFNWVL